MFEFDVPGHILETRRVRRPATDARLRAMARQLAAARDEDETQVLCEGIAEDIIPRRLVLLGLARRSLPAGDQTTLLGMASEGDQSTC